MKILLLGKNGQLGEELHNQSMRLGYDMKAYSKRELDITNSKKVRARIKSIKPDVVINASAYHVLADCERYPHKAFLVNTVSIKGISEACNEVGARFVSYSTDYVFDGLKGSPYIESDKPNPLQIYGISKYAGEITALKYSPNTIIIRTCGVFGGKKGSRSKGGNFILSILKQAKGKKKLEVSSEQIVSPTYAHNLAEATLGLINKRNVNGIYHLVNEGYCSWADFATEVVKLKEVSTRIIPVDRKGSVGTLKRPLFSALKNTRAKELGVVLPDWGKGVRQYLKSIQ